jgi:hypothetical protein
MCSVYACLKKTRHYFDYFGYYKSLYDNPSRKISVFICFIYKIAVCPCSRCDHFATAKYICGEQEILLIETGSYVLSIAR